MNNDFDGPLVTVITVVFNGEECIGGTIESVINQSYPNIEYIVIDGGSTDGTVEALKSYDGEIDSWISEDDRGIYDAMNKGIAMCHGEWVCFMNAGDRFYGDHVIEYILPFLDQNITLIYGDCKFIGADFSYIYRPKKIGKLSFLKHVIFNHQAILFNKKYLIPYDLKYRISADFDLVAKLFFRYGSGHFLKVDTLVAICPLDGISNDKIFESYLNRLESLRVKSKTLYFILLVYTPAFYLKVSVLEVVRNWKLYNIYRKIKHKKFVEGNSTDN